MSEHLSDELPRLLTGEAPREVVLAAAAHLRVCPDCQQELVSAVVAHAALTSARRFAPEIVPPQLVAPASADATDAESVPDAHPAALPDLSTVFAQAREDASAAAKAPARHRRRLIGIAAAAVVVAGGGVAGGLVATSSSGPSTQTVQLSAFGSAAQPGSAAEITISGRTLRMDASKLPPLDPHHVYELWATDSKRTEMQSLGTFVKANRVEMSAPHSVLAKYRDFEVSVQPTSQLAKYSGRSVVRGDYR